MPRHSSGQEAFYRASRAAPRPRGRRGDGITDSVCPARYAGGGPSAAISVSTRLPGSGV